MTMPQPAQDGLPPLFDPGNALLAQMPSNMMVGKVPTPEGERGVLTIRTANVTLTLILDKSEAGQWADNLTTLRDSLSGSNLVVPARGEAVRIADAARSAGNGS